MTVFAGDAASFHEWQFRLQIKKSLCTAEELPALTAKVVDALRGEALSCAMEIGLAKLMEANGLDLLVQKVQERLFPQRTAEARELLKQGMRIGGPMSRVPGEPMTSYISRRRRWWTLVHEMDNTLEAPWRGRVACPANDVHDPWCRQDSMETATDVHEARRGKIGEGNAGCGGKECGREAGHEHR